MKKINVKALVIGTVVCLLPWIMGIVMWNTLPQSIPIHWNFSGEIDGYAPKWVAVFVLPGFLAVLNVLCHLLASHDKRRENYSKALSLMTYWLIPALSVLITPICFLTAGGAKIKVEIIAPVLCGLLLIFVGNYLPKCKQNSTMGIKLPWTLKSEENWNKTHRLAGWLWIICGFIVLITTFVGIPYLLFAVIALAVLVPTVYSYAISKKCAQDE
ncbi:MAG: SdpI family protein [Acutalibacteraceae bacterium]